MIYKNVKLGKNIIIQDDVFIGLPSREFLSKTEEEWPATIIGDSAVIRSGTNIYCGVETGDRFQTGHNVLIRENTVIGNNVRIGTSSIIDGKTVIGSNVNMQSMVYIPINTVIGDFVFIGPNAVFTNDKYPIRVDVELVGPRICKGASIGANATILAGIEIGEGAIVAACAIVTKNVPAWSIAVGNPARIKDLPDDLKKLNKI